MFLISVREVFQVLSPSLLGFVGSSCLVTTPSLHEFSTFRRRAFHKNSIGIVQIVTFALSVIHHVSYLRRQNSTVTTASVASEKTATTAPAKFFLARCEKSIQLDDTNASWEKSWHILTPVPLIFHEVFRVKLLSVSSIQHQTSRLIYRTEGLA